MMRFPEQFRQTLNGSVFQSARGNTFGVFIIPAKDAKGRGLRVIACDGTETGWEHVSVSCDGSKHIPTWKEMSLVKDLFWQDDDCVVQFHPKKADFVNMHEGCLHLWRFTGGEFPMPPKICV